MFRFGPIDLLTLPVTVMDDFCEDRPSDNNCYEYTAKDGKYVFTAAKATRFADDLPTTDPLERHAGCAAGNREGEAAVNLEPRPQELMQTP
jgi:hypothetical protein